MVQSNIKVHFSTPDAQPAQSDFRMLTGQGLGPWSALLRADTNALSAYNAMIQAAEFQNPLRWKDLNSSDFSGIILPGGHAPGMKEYLESVILQKFISDFFSTKKLVGAICHGTVLAARSKTPNGKSILYGLKTTSLLRTQELLAWIMTGLWLKNYYRTYPETVQSEVTRCLLNSRDFISGPAPLKRDSLEHLNYGFVVEDQNYISARWPGDTHLFAMTIVKYLKSTVAKVDLL